MMRSERKTEKWRIPGKWTLIFLLILLAFYGYQNILAENYDCPYADLIIRRGKGDTFYRTLTLTDEVKEHYAKAYGYDGAELLSA